MSAIRRLRLLLPALLLAGCAAMPDTPVPAGGEARHAPRPYVTLKHPEWTRDAALYQINFRQFTAEGTLRAAQAELPRLKALGVDILWLMPVHPIGQVERKGSLGSPYAVRDYRAVNPEFGTLDDLRAFVAAAHAQGQKVILDWVANHSAWDNPLVESNPEWYKRDWKGDFHPTAWWDWSDIIEFDYRQSGLREWMAQTMRWWVEDVGIDGFRCDVAGFVPIEFWETLRVELEAVKPVFLLAEWESRDLHAQAFDATYAWSWWEAMHRIAQGQADANALHIYYSWNENFYPPEAQRMTFVSNHDKNAWEATEYEAFGPMLDAAIVLSVVGEGMPMIYNGQEAGNRKRLAFFERDPIVWREDPQGALWRHLLALKKQQPALWNAPWGARMIPVPHDRTGKALVFVRGQGGDRVFAAFNFSAELQQVTLGEGPYPGRYRDAFDGQPVELAGGARLDLPPWGYRVLIGN